LGAGACDGGLWVVVGAPEFGPELDAELGDDAGLLIDELGTFPSAGVTLGGGLGASCDCIFDAGNGRFSGGGGLASGCELMASTSGIACEGLGRVMAVVPSAVDTGCGAVSFCFTSRVLL
jgi:hypothetical protein